MHMNSKKYDSFTKIFQKKEHCVKEPCSSAFGSSILAAILFFLNYTVKRRHPQGARTLNPMNICMQTLPLLASPKD